MAALTGMKEAHTTGQLGSRVLRFILAFGSALLLTGCSPSNPFRVTQ